MQQTKKIYAFNALDDTRVEILWSLRSQNRDKIFSRFISDNFWLEVDSIADCDIAIYPHKAFVPETLEFNDSIFAAVETAKQHSKPIVIDATSDSDVFLDIPSANVLRCGLYRSLQQKFETECPYWSNHRTDSRLESLDIGLKKSKPAVGFCGTTSSMGKLANLSKKLVPDFLTKLILSQGKKARKTDPRIVEGMSLQLREKAIRLLALDSRIESCFSVTNKHQSYYVKDDNNKQLLEDLFVVNMEKCDYVLCIRGSGNYSGRFYMALSAGRIPVVVDTDIVIPAEDQLNLIKVPLDSIENISDLILEHFSQTTAQEFESMKAQNRQVYQRFLAPEKFLPNFLVDCIDQASNCLPKISNPIK